MTTVEEWQIVFRTILSCPYSQLSDIPDEKIILWIIDSIDMDAWQYNMIKQGLDEKIKEVNK